MQWYSTYTRLIWLALTLLFAWLIFRPASEAVEKLDHLGKVLESTGGKILLLTMMAMIFFVASMGFFFYVLDAIQAGTLKDDDVMVNMLVQFMTGTAFGTALGALINMLGVGTKPQG